MTGDGDPPPLLCGRWGVSRDVATMWISIFPAQGVIAWVVVKLTPPPFL